jgi:glyoxylase-like metal-dependent hydrolase (beta-lactamase superfamily II)
MSDQYTIRPLCTGYIHTSLGNCIYHESVHSYYKGVDGYLNTPIVVFLLEGNNHRILVDTGMSTTEIANKLHITGSWQPEGYAIQDQVKKIGINPEEIDIIILTHMHWDHYYNIDKFPKARIYVQKSEWDFSHNPTPTYYRIYEHPKWNRRPQYAGIENQFELVTGETEIVPGISVYPSPGHSIGHQTASVNTKEGTYHLCGDLIFLYENLHPHEDIAYELTPPARYQNLPAWWDSVLELKRRAGEEKYILPCHDPKIEVMYNNAIILGK